MGNHAVFSLNNTQSLYIQTKFQRIIRVFKIIKDPPTYKICNLSLQNTKRRIKNIV
jgi:hypothetical protein